MPFSKAGLSEVRGVHLRHRHTYLRWKHVGFMRYYYYYYYYDYDYDYYYYSSTDTGSNSRAYSSTDTGSNSRADSSTDTSSNAGSFTGSYAEPHTVSDAEPHTGSNPGPDAGSVRKVQSSNNVGFKLGKWLGWELNSRMRDRERFIQPILCTRQLERGQIVDVCLCTAGRWLSWTLLMEP